MIITKQLPILPSNAQTIIIVLGQCLLPSGQPHPWLIDRVNTAYQLLTKNKLDISTTYFIVSGSDVSNREYGISAKNRHPSEASLMYKFLLQIHEETINKKSQQQKNQTLKLINFGEHVLVEDQANTTIQNFYYAFRVMHSSKAVDNIKNIYVVTSDFHMKRAKFCFDTMFFSKNSNAQIVRDRQSFNYQAQVFFSPSNTKWRNEYDKTQKYQKQQRLYHEKWLIDETLKTASKLWQEFTQNNK